MIFFTRKPDSRPLKDGNPLNEHVASSNFPQKLFFLISILFALLLVSIGASAAGKTVPATPGPVSGQVNVCAYVGTPQALTYSISPVSGAELYLWTVPSTVQIVSGQGTTSISVTFAPGFTAGGNKQIRVRAISQEGNSADRIFYLVSQQPPTPASVMGPANACVYIGTGNAAIYTTARDAAATGYIWGTDPATTMVSHPNGTGVNDTVIKVVFKNGYRTAPVTVQAINNCGFSAARSLTVSGAAPGMPGPISGPTNACAYMLPNGAIATYSISPVTGATSYTWSTPANCIVNHPNGAGSTDITITVQYPSDFTGSSSITVFASSGCEDGGTRVLNVTKLNPGTPGAITPVLKVICPDREYSYSLPSMPTNSTAVNWTVPVESLSFSGQGTASIIVQYPGTHVNGLVTATAVSNCASSATRQSPVILSRCQVERGVAENNATETGRGGQQNNAQQKQQLNSDVANPAGAIQVNIFPNPSKGNFKLQVITREKEVINIKLLDLQGREIKKMSMTLGQPLFFGNELRPGTYILEVSQGKIKHTEKLLKL